MILASEKSPRDVSSSPKTASSLDFIKTLHFKSYVKIPSGLLTLLMQSDIQKQDKLFYLAAVAEYQHFQQAIYRPANIWATKFSRKSKKPIYRSQTRLESLGLLHVERSTANGLNEMNRVTPHLNESWYQTLAADNTIRQSHSVEASPVLENGQARLKWAMDHTVFFKINLSILNTVLGAALLSSFEKLLWLYCYQRSFIAYSTSKNNPSAVISDT